MHKPSRPRTPRYWPRMKVRGARRRRAAPFQRMARQFDMLGEVFMRFGEQIYKIGKPLTICTWANTDTAPTEGDHGSD